MLAILLFIFVTPLLLALKSALEKSEEPLQYPAAVYIASLIVFIFYIFYN